jgi:hypothetical protein
LKQHPGSSSSSIIGLIYFLVVYKEVTVELGIYILIIEFDGWQWYEVAGFTSIINRCRSNGGKGDYTNCSPNVEWLEYLWPKYLSGTHTFD